MRLNWTLTLFIACVFVFLLQMLNLINEELFAFTPSLAFQRPWTFVTSMFLHADITHLFFNMFALIMFGLPLEARIGSNRFIILYFLSGILGGFGYMITSMMFGDPTIPAIGASGAIYGVMGALAMLMPTAQVFLFGFFPMPMIFAVVFWSASEILGLFAPGNIAHGAHLAGLGLGILYGLYLHKRENRRRNQVRIIGYADWEQ